MNRVNVRWLIGSIALVPFWTGAVLAEESPSAINAHAKVPDLKDIKRPSQNAQDLLSPKVVAQTLIQITDVQLTPTTDGLTLALLTADGAKLQSVPTRSGNTLSIDIPNAQLAREFRQEKPIAEIQSITVTAVGSDRVRVTIVGVDRVPTANIVSGQTGLNVGVQVAAQPEEGEEEVVVTAQKRPERPQDIPASLTVLPRQELEDARVNSVRNIAVNTPNFYSTIGDRAFNFQGIRGLNNSNFLVRDVLGFYVDDVPYENIHQFVTGELFDLERVEVLRGPQNTLYGRSAQGGVVNIISRPPTNSPEGRIVAGYGNYNQRQVQLSLSDAIVPDKLRFRLAGAYNARDGFTRNTLLNEDANPSSSLAGRANLLWTPSKEWTISLNATGAQNQDGDFVSVPSTQRDPFRVERNIRGSTDLSSNTQSLKIAYDGPAFRATSITSRNAIQWNYLSDGDYTADDLLRSQSSIDSTILSQEIRFQSPKTAERFRWLLGGYFQSRNLDIDPQSTTTTPLGAAAFGGDVGTVGTIAKFDQTTYAIFGQIDFKLSDPLTLTTGLRYELNRETLNRTPFSQSPDSTITPNGLVLVDSKTADSAVIPKFALEYRFSPNVSVYGSATRGYRPGTQNYISASLDTLRVRPEKSWNYELGLKSSWFNNRLSANLALFSNTLTDYQVVLAGPDGFFRDISNAKVRTQGIELEVIANLMKGLDLRAGFGYTDAKFTDYRNPFTGESFNGNKLIYAPDYTYNLALQYRNPGGGIFSRVELQGFGTVFFDTANTTQQNPFALVNAQIGYEWKNYGIYLFVNNLFDKTYIVNSFVAIPPDSLVGYGDRRTFGFQVRATF